MTKTKKRATQVLVAPVRSLEEIKAVYLANAQDNTKGTYDGLTTEEIARWNHRLMFGE